MEIRKAAVIGAGVMGGGIAAQIANAGIPVVLLDRAADGPNRRAIVEGALDRLLKAEPAAFMSKANARRITLGTVEDDLGLIADADWIVEVVLEERRPAAPQPDHLVPVVDDAVDHGLDARVEPGHVAAARQDPDPHGEVLTRLASGLRAHERIEQGDASRSRDRDGLPVVPGVLDADTATRRAEQATDVVGDLREEVAGIVLAVHAVRDAAPVRVDQSADQLPWEARDDLLLPGFEHDSPLVLPAGPVLREQERPALRTGDDLDRAVRHLVNRNAVVRHHRLHGRGTLGNDLRIA